MSIAPEAFLTSAEPLAHRPEEIDRRNCISRAYYFAYHAAQRRAVELGRGIFADVPTHEAVIQAFTTWTAKPDAIKVGVLLRDMKKRRVLADYLLKMDLEASLTTLQLGTANKVRTLLATL